MVGFTSISTAEFNFLDKTSNIKAHTVHTNYQQSIRASELSNISTYSLKFSSLMTKTV